jgi:hypothetical protein
MRIRTFVLPAFAGLGALAAGLVARVRYHDPEARPAASEPRPVERRPASPTAPPLQVAPRRPASLDGARDTAGSDDVIGSTDPTSADYDPTTIVRTMQMMPSEILKKEPRNPAFAGPREIALRDRIVERLRKRVPFETKVGTKCYTSSCELTVQGASNVNEMNVALEALELSRLADSAEIGSWKDPDDPRLRELRITLLYSAALRDHAVYDQWLRQHEAHDGPAHKAP